MSSVLVQEQDGGELLIHIVRNFSKGAMLRYKKIERFPFPLVITARNLRCFFQGHGIMVKTNYLIRQVLIKATFGMKNDFMVCRVVRV